MIPEMLLDRPGQLCLALAVEAGVGYPAWLFRAVGHPVSWVGHVIQAMEAQLNRGGIGIQQASGAVCALVLVGIGGGFGWLIDRIAAGLPFRVALVALATATGLAMRSLWCHLRAVEQPLVAGELAAARSALSRVVGRDVAPLDGSGIAAAAIETLAESFCDGVVAPVFWFLVTGLPGLFAFKAISTADSMIGHMDARYRHFGTACARLDDAMNWIPARIAALLLLAAAGGRGWRVLKRDRAAHASPNAGWPESAMAGALGVQLGGGAFYDGEWLPRATLGDGPRPDPADLSRALRLYLCACVLMVLLVVGLA